MSNSFVQDPDIIAKMFDSIVIPEGHLLNGSHGLLAVIFKTDDPEIICSEIDLLTTNQAQNLTLLFENVIPKISIQREGVIWKFNRPQSALDDLQGLGKAAHAKDMLISEIQVTAPTFPFVEGFYADYEFEGSAKENLRPNPSPQVKTSKLSATDVLAPIVTLGSIYTATKLLSN